VSQAALSKRVRNEKSRRLNNEPQQPMSRLFRYLKPYYRALTFASASSITNKIFDLMPPIMVGWIIDTVSRNPPQWIQTLIGTSDSWTIAIFCSLLIIIIFGVESFFEWVYQLSFMKLAQRVQHDLRVDTYRKLQRREIAYFEEERTGNLMSMISDDVNQLERFLNSGFNDLIQLTVVFLFAGITIWMVSWEMAVIGFLPIPVMLVGVFYYQQKIAPHYLNIREAVGSLSNRLENNIAGMLVIKSFTAEQFEADRVEDTSNQYKQVNFGAIKLSAVFIPLIRMLIALGMAGAMLLGAYWILNGSGKITVGELTFFAMMVQRMLWPVTRLGQVFDAFERARASARRIFGLMDAPNRITEVEKPVDPKQVTGNMSFNKVSFHYQPDMPILNNLSFDIEAGKTIGFAGTTGAGKTTLIKLLLRLYDVTDGAITMDGIDLRQMRKRSLRQNIALVSQEVYLFHGTIKENIAYSLADVTNEKIKAAAKKAELHQFIVGLPDGYETLVGERGIKLSGGQRQRLSLARAILKDAPILILDEATSAVDTETERAIQKNIHQFTKNRTAIVIAHRLSTIRQADCIFILDKGGIAEQGTHEELLALDGVYAGLWRVQTGEVG